MSSTKLQRELGARSIHNEFSNVMFREHSESSTFIQFLREQFTDINGDNYHLVPVCLTRSHNDILTRLYDEDLDTGPKKISIITNSNKNISPLQNQLEDRRDFDINLKHFNKIFKLPDLGNSICKAVQHYHHLGFSPIVVFDSISALIDDFHLDSVYKFLNILNSRLTKSEAFAAYTLLEDTHENHTISTIQALFEAVITPRSDGSVEVSKQVTEKYEIKR